MKRILPLLCVLAALGAAPLRPSATVPLSGLTARPLGPATMGGRITAVAVVESRPAIHYIGAAAGGVWKTTDDGKTWACVFEGAPWPSIGAVAVSQSHPNVVYVGTGEANARNSVSRGNGVFVSTDGGKTWMHQGLAESHHIGKILVHPTDPRTAYVAALGHLWGSNPERGVFRTSNGGKTWQHVLKLGDETGAVDLAMAPNDPHTIYAAAYRVRRDAFSGGNPAEQFGPRAGIYRTRDGGTTWTRLTRGLPTRPMGRIGLDVYRKNSRIVYAVVQTDQTDISRVQGQSPSPVKNKQVVIGPVEQGGVFRSGDGGDTWVKVNDLCPRPFYFSQIRVDPTNDARVWVLGIPLFFSLDRGRLWSDRGAVGPHVDHHDLWINPADPRHMILGNDGGLDYTRQGGATWTAVDNLPISQFYAVCVDQRTPYRIYGGLQDNGTWGGPSRTNTTGIANRDWFHVLGLDGFACQMSDDPDLIYAQGQYGKLHRVDLRTRQATLIAPRPVKAGLSFRFNWSAPLLVSPHDSRTVYYGGNQLFRSTDKGQTWRLISPDLTHGKENTAYRSTGHTLTAIAESPRKQGLIYTGSDDGKVHTTSDGKAWQDRSGALGAVLRRGSDLGWITCVECSPHAEETAWVSVSRHRQGDFAPYLVRTDDAGKTWKSATGNLPREGPIHVVRASSRHPELLFAGTELGLYVSLDRGEHWQKLPSDLPAAPVHDLVIHPRERELVIATHGRGLYVVEIGALEELTAEVRARKVHLCAHADVALPPETRKAVLVPERSYLAPNPPDGMYISYWLGERIANGTLTVLSGKGDVVANLPLRNEPGLNRVLWRMKRIVGRGEEANIAPGEYRLQLRCQGELQERKVRVR